MLSVAHKRHRWAKKTPVSWERSSMDLLTISLQSPDGERILTIPIRNGKVRFDRSVVRGGKDG
jgi:hypothetical protein